MQIEVLDFDETTGTLNLEIGEEDYALMLKVAKQQGLKSVEDLLGAALIEYLLEKEDEESNANSNYDQRTPRER